MTDPSSITTRARERAKTSGTKVGAWYIGDNSPRDLDGWQGKVAVSDGQKTTEIDVTLSGTLGGRPGMPVDELALAEVVEHLAGRFPSEARLAAMAESSPLRIDVGGDDWRRVLGQLSEQPSVGDESAAPTDAEGPSR